MHRPTRVQLRMDPGWRLPDGAVIVSRRSLHANPFTPADAIAQGQAVDGRSGRAVAVQMHRRWLRGYGPDTVTRGGWVFDRRDVLAVLPALAGRDLACWCSPTEHCPADNLLELAGELVAA